MIHPKLLIEPTDSCIEWTGAFHKNGYGVVSLNRKVAAERGLARVQFVHRMSYLQHKGDMPQGLVVRHLCHNKKCFNPAHLEVGTQYENFKDSLEAGTVTRKLSEEDVMKIRESTMSNRKLADLYGVSSTTVYHIKHGSKWRNTNGPSTIQTEGGD